MREAYLDIETTGLSFLDGAITVIGIFLTDGGTEEFVQLVGEDITREKLLQALDGVETIFTYNGSRFDLPFIQTFLGVDLSRHCAHRDLMFDCWRNNLYGGFKAVEVRLGIDREMAGITGLDAVSLWWRYRRHNDRHALDTLLRYNKEDVVNLRAVRERLLAEP